jgi:hypothetical protein
MNNELMETPVTEKELFQPCSVLAQMRLDMVAVAKSKNLPFLRRYDISETDFLVISIRKLSELEFHLEVTSARGTEEATDPKLKKLLDLAHLYIWKALSTSLSRNPLMPCVSMEHSGADEVLALYNGIEVFRKSPKLPYVISVTTPRASYELLSIQQKGSQFELAFETNNIYGNSMKWQATFSYMNEVLERADKMVAEVLSEWILPGGQLLRAERERTNPVSVRNKAKAAASANQ